MLLWKIFVVGVVILIINKIVRIGTSQSGGGTGRKAIPWMRQGRSDVQRVQCPWCSSWNISNYRDLRGAYWFLILLTLGLILLFTPVFPRINACNDCGRRWSFGNKR
jgi:hypothetical protein